MAGDKLCQVCHIKPYTTTVTYYDQDKNKYRARVCDKCKKLYKECS